MRNYAKTFLSEKRAKAFAKELSRNEKVCDLSIVSFRDAFNQNNYRVEWNID